MCSSPTLHVSARRQHHVAGQASLAPYIQQSWDRCAGLDPGLLADPNPMRKADLDIRRETHRDLMRHAAADIVSLESLVRSARSVVLLADSTGLILQQHGCQQFLDKARRVALVPGVNWAESLRGTNAIGTALHEKRAIRVHGSEHFLACNRILSCDAAPVWNGTGELIGVLDLTGPASQRQDYAWALVQAYAANISNRLLEDTSLRRFVFHTDAAHLDGANRAIIIVDDEDCIAGANMAALGLLDADWALIGTPVAQWLDRVHGPDGHVTPLCRRDGKPLVGAMQRSQVRAPYARPAPVSSPVVPRAGTVIHDITFEPMRDQGVRAVAAQLSVLLHGETGTGKEELARQIHSHSVWRSGRFVAINCGALPESLIESELFGYEAGAFTGARREGARGLLAQANGGVLFLDEIGDMPIGLQTRLLRILQDREVQPLGSEKRIALQFGVISASHQDLSRLVQHGLFRSDLYYRLQGLQLSLPSLRQRDDLGEFLTRQARFLGLSMTADALTILCSYGWPGNYREAQNVLRRLPCQYPDATRIESWMLPPGLLATARTAQGKDGSALPAENSVDVFSAHAALTPDTRKSLQYLEQDAILRALDDSQGNVTRAAQRLGIHRSTLHRKLRALAKR